MIRRVLKDIREAWPYWVGMVVLSLLPIAAGWRTFAMKPDHGGFAATLDRFREAWQGILPYFALIHYLVFLLIAVSLFGAEFKRQTMARLLAQPVSRRRIWFEKSLAYLLTISAVLVCEWRIYGKLFRAIEPLYQLAVSEQDAPFGPWYPVTSWVLCFLAVAALALASGTLTSLFLRQTHTAFWAALVLPVLVFLVLMAGDALILNLVFGFAVSGWVQNWFYFRSNLLSVDLCLFDMAAALWFVIVYPLAWLKFKKLEV
jgi:hypothetical protein